MDPNINLERLRRQRNGAAIFAVTLILIAIATALPKSLADYQALRAFQTELVDLQDRIVGTQAKIVAEQKQIVELQQEITTLRSR
jgi:peptidoglycan hydrolase CwlO-like protein